MIPRLVLDSNVIISAIISDGKPREILKMALKGRAQIVLSEPILKEIEKVLVRPKIGFSEAALEMVIWELIDIAEIVDYQGEKINAISDDPPDNRILECALAGAADFIISGDDHLLSLGAYKNIPIMNPASFLKTKDL